MSFSFVQGFEVSEVVPLFGHAGLDTCDREPIHVPGSIQPHGVLLVLERDDFVIREYAGDIRFMLGLDPTRLPQLSLSALFEQGIVLQITQHVRGDAEMVPATVVLGVNSRTGALPLDLTVHAWCRRVIVEIEPARRSLSGDGDPLTRVTKMIAQLSAPADMIATCTVAARTVRELFGFSRACVYEFLPDGSGRVIAEDRVQNADSFLNLHFPSSDIPAQAREMYRRTWLRSIPDIDYTPSPVLACSGIQIDTPLDMTYCSLRSVSPIHLEYLRNMGVAASLSLSIVINGELWGLIACHNDMPRYVATDLRAAGELYAQILSLHLAAKIQTDTARRRIAPRTVLGELANRVPLSTDFMKELVDGQVSVLDLVSATGVALYHDGRLLTRGVTPPESLIHTLVHRLDTETPPVYHTSQLGREFPAFAACTDTASGMLAATVSREPLLLVMWFRPEVARTVHWAGNPRKSLEAGPYGPRLTPRHSFKAWQDEVVGQSLPWDEVDLDAARALRIWLLEAVLRQLDAARREREAQFARQSALMAELDHRVKNSLTVIQAMMRQSQSSARSLNEFVGDMERRIITMGNTHAALADNNWDGAGLRTLLDAETARLAPEEQRRIRLDGEDCRLSAAAAMTLAMVFHELVDNARRYGALSQPSGHVLLRWSMADTASPIVLDWKELDGPAVAEPIRRSFGAVLIERAMKHELNGKGELTFEKDGLACTLVIPREHVVKLAQE